MRSVEQISAWAGKQVASVAGIAHVSADTFSGRVSLLHTVFLLAQCFRILTRS